MLNLLPRIIQPREIAIKRGSLIRLKYLTGQTAVIICGKASARTSSVLEKATSHLMGAKIACHVFDGISGDPTAGAVSAAAGFLEEKKPDWIIALGGGAVLDAAKLAWVKYEHPSLELSATYRNHT